MEQAGTKSIQGNTYVSVKKKNIISQYYGNF